LGPLVELASDLESFDIEVPGARTLKDFIEIEVFVSNYVAEVEFMLND
jgi:hypothetical protein